MPVGCFFPQAVAFTTLREEPHGACWWDWVQTEEGECSERATERVTLRVRWEMPVITIHTHRERETRSSYYERGREWLVLNWEKERESEWRQMEQREQAWSVFIQRVRGKTEHVGVKWDRRSDQYWDWEREKENGMRDMVSEREKEWSVLREWGQRKSLWDWSATEVRESACGIEVQQKEWSLLRLRERERERERMGIDRENGMRDRVSKSDVRKKSDQCWEKWETEHVGVKWDRRSEQYWDWERERENGTRDRVSKSDVREKESDQCWETEVRDRACGSEVRQKEWVILR